MSPAARMGRPRGQTLNRDKVIRAARQVAQAGTANLNMTSLSRMLGVTPMALYRHVKNKHDLLALVFDDVLSEISVPGPDAGDWAGRLEIFHRDVVAALKELPGLDEMLYELPQTPNSSRLMEGYFEILRDGGLSEREAVLAYNTLYYLAIGSLFSDTARAALCQPPSPAANSPAFPSDVLERMQVHASTIDAEEIRAWGVQAVIALASSRNQRKGRRAPKHRQPRDPAATYS
jgi:AcrR family transcriptional regulator